MTDMLRDIVGISPVNYTERECSFQLTDWVLHEDVKCLQHVVDTLDEAGIRWELVQYYSSTVAIFRDEPTDLVKVQPWEEK